MVHGPNGTNEDYNRDALNQRGATENQIDVILEEDDVEVLGESDEYMLRIGDEQYDSVESAVEDLVGDEEPYTALEAEESAGVKSRNPDIVEDGGEDRSGNYMSVAAEFLDGKLYKQHVREFEEKEETEGVVPPGEYSIK